MASRIQHKRSNVKGKRPIEETLDFGELGLNFNSEEPGLYFKDSINRIRKIGPTNVSFTGPTPPFSIGELFYDQENSALKICTNPDSELIDEAFETTRSLPPSGTSGFIIYVSPGDNNASDSLLNDGSVKPFLTLNRACLEIARQSSIDQASAEEFFNKYTIVLLPGKGTVYNGKGVTSSEFNLVNNNGLLTPDQYELFNSPKGGLIIPRGTSIVGTTKDKSVLSPTFIPNFVVNVDRVDLVSETNSDDSTPILKLTSESSLENILFTDKFQTSIVKTLGFDPSNNDAVFTTDEPHGLVNGDLIRLRLIDPNLNNVYGELRGTIITVSSLEFKITPEGSTAVLEYNAALSSDINPTDDNRNILLLDNLVIKSHHLLNCVEWSSSEDLTEYYEKVQIFFSRSRIQSFPQEVGGNSFISGLSLQSNLGLCGIVVNGNNVSEVNLQNLRFKSSQTIADCYEVYTNFAGENGWRDLRLLFGDLTNEELLSRIFQNFSNNDIRIKPRINSFGKFLRTLGDCRHLGILASNAAIVHLNSSLINGFWPAIWALDGSKILCDSLISNTGIVSLVEGFQGIYTRESFLNSSKYNILGIVRARSELTQDSQSKRVETGSYIKLISTVSSSELCLDLSKKLDIPPLEIIPGDIISVRDSSNNILTAEVSSTGLSSDKLKLFINTVNNQIIGDVTLLSEISILKTVETRELSDTLFKLRLSGQIEPKEGQIIRFSQDSTNSAAVRANVQLDPEFGGWNQVFMISSVEKISSDLFDVSLLLGDDSSPFILTKTPYYINQFSTREEKIYISERYSILQPPNTWREYKPYLPLQNIGEAYQGDANFNTLADPETYNSDKEVYARGLQWIRDLNIYMRSQPIIYNNEPSRLAVNRLLTIFGYTQVEIDSILLEQFEINRFITFSELGFIPSLTVSGYLQTNEMIPIELVNPSINIIGNGVFTNIGSFFEFEGINNIEDSNSNLFGGFSSINGTFINDKISESNLLDSQSGRTLLGDL